ncbi:hypothetical protein KKJ04_14805 [Xenorhabdus bovienii]|uniref:hypothetical protein n=1 Tax=Xenorhabdus bovienii TaxID=40576 RepID=UPI0023B29CFA|nr:hypothetical protein [Xenorhabdus bovienii]MDE9446838.1 hypothetical protein [Xenorhabdus bovienii]
MNTFSFKITWRNFGLVGLNALAVTLFVHELTTYLAPLQKPVPLALAFYFSLALAIFMELRYGFNRFVIVQLTATVLVFLCGTFIAYLLRDQYLSFTVILTSEPEIESVIGTDYYTALTNPAIGYGSCFAAGLSFSRLFLWKRFRRILLSIFMRDRDEKSCPCCGSIVKK